MARFRHACMLAAAFLLGISSAPPIFAADSPPADPASNSPALLDYLEHWEFGLDINEDKGPRFFIDPIVPLYRGDDNGQVAFLEPRLTYRNSEWLMNFGGGYRRLVHDSDWLIGGNMFYDYDSQYSHSRLGWGLEALSSYAELRSNVYVPTSGERTVEEGTGGTTKERAVPGFDLELGAPVPYYSRLKMYGGVNWYALPDFRNRYGWTLRTEYTPLPFIVIDGILSNDTKTNVDWGVKVAFRIPLGANLEQARSPLKLDATAFPESDASEFLFHLVERRHEIVTQRSVTTGGLVVEAARGGS